MTILMFGSLFESLFRYCRCHCHLNSLLELPFLRLSSSFIYLLNTKNPRANIKLLKWRRWRDQFSLHLRLKPTEILCLFFFSSIDNEKIKTTDTSARVCAIQATIKLNAVVSFVLKELLRFECSYMLRYSIQMHAFILHFYIIIKEQRGAISLERQTMMAHTDVMQ